jgi:hypothetical protein
VADKPNEQGFKKYEGFLNHYEIISFKKYQGFVNQGIVGKLSKKRKKVHPYLIEHHVWNTCKLKLDVVMDYGKSKSSWIFSFWTSLDWITLDVDVHMLN